MKKVSKIREIKSKLKIKELTKDESKKIDLESEISESETNEFSSFISSPESPILRQSLQTGQETQVQRESERTSEPIYSPRATAQTSQYKTAEITPSGTLPTLNVGRDFAIRHSESSLPENTRTEEKLRHDQETQIEEKKYDTQRGSRKRYPWEV